MHKKLASLIIFSFVAIQVITFSHAAIHGFVEHDHEGEVCELFLNFEKNKSLSKVDDIFLVFKKHPQISNDNNSYKIVFLPSYRTASPRAPPVFS